MSDNLLIVSGEMLTEEELDLVMNGLDIDGDGRLHYREFVKMMKDTGFFQTRKDYQVCV